MYPGAENQQQGLTAFVLAAFGATLEVWIDPVTPCPTPTRYLIKLNSIAYNGILFELRSPLVVALYEEKDDHSWVCESKELGIAAVGKTRELAVHSLSEDFAMLWDEIAQCPDERLTSDAQELKQKLNALVKSVTR